MLDLASRSPVSYKGPGLVPGVVAATEPGPSPARGSQMLNLLSSCALQEPRSQVPKLPEASASFPPQEEVPPKQS